MRMHAKDKAMAKGQKRTSRETRKPKSAKPKPTATPAPLWTKSGGDPKAKPGGKT